MPLRNDQLNPIPGDNPGGPGRPKNLYAWICRLDPLQALNVTR